jgi:general secretion pathway protein N
MLPAQYAFQQIEQRLLPIRLTDIEGSIWSGSARTVSDQRFTLHNLSWQLSVWELLSGKINLSWQIDDGLGQASGILVFTDDDVRLQSLNADLDMQRLVPELVKIPVRVAGRLVVEDVSVSMRKGSLATAGGRLHWRQATMLRPHYIPLGSFSARLTAQQGALNLQLSDNEAALALQGKLNLRPDRSYHYQAELGIRDATVSGLVETIAALGPMDDSGAVWLAGQGRW